MVGRSEVILGMRYRHRHVLRGVVRRHCGHIHRRRDYGIPKVRLGSLHVRLDMVARALLAVVQPCVWNGGPLLRADQGLWGPNELTFMHIGRWQLVDSEIVRYGCVFNSEN